MSVAPSVIPNCHPELVSGSHAWAPAVWGIPRHPELVSGSHACGSLVFKKGTCCLSCWNEFSMTVHTYHPELVSGSHECGSLCFRYPPSFWTCFRSPCVWHLQIKILKRVQHDVGVSTWRAFAVFMGASSWIYFRISCVWVLMTLVFQHATLHHQNVLVNLS